MTDAELLAISRAVIDEWQVGGFADDIYEEFAIVVAKRAIAAEREAIAKMTEAEAKRSYSNDADNWDDFNSLAAAIRARGKEGT